MSAAIVVESVSKKFLIGSARYSSLRDVITRPVRRLLGRAAQSETERTQEFWALKDVSFEVEKGATLGIIGPNGAGKSTLLKLMSRVSKPTMGAITTHGRVSALIEVGAGFHPELTGRENVYLNGSILGMTKKEIDRKFDAIVDFSGIEQFIDTPVKYYSSGMFARLGFSVAAHVEPDILLVDEVLSVGDWGFQQKCFEKMREIVRRGTTVVFVSHNLNAVSSLCTRGMLIDRGRQAVYGDVGEAITGYNRLMSEPNTGQDKSAVPPVHIDLVRLTNDAGRDTHLFETGEGFVLVVDVCFSQPMPNPVVHLQLRDRQGIELFSTDTQRSGLQLGAVEPGHVLRLQMKGRINLLGGSYRFASEVMPDPASPPAAEIGSVCLFEVLPSEKADGIIPLSTEMELLAGPPLGNSGDGRQGKTPLAGPPAKSKNIMMPRAIKPGRSGKVNVVFRYDDVFLKGGSVERDNLDLKVMNLFVSKGVPLSVAVIPGEMRESEMSPEVPGDSVGSESLVMPFILAHRDLIEVCQHGYCHRLAGTSEMETELAGRPAAEQQLDIEKGRALLSAAGMPDVSVFIPPHNTFDQSTLDALSAAGFRAMSAGATLHGARTGDGFAFVPSLTGLWGVTDAPGLSHNIRDIAFFVVLFHNYNLKERGDPRFDMSLRELEMLLERLKREPNISFLTISQAIAAAPEQFSMNTFRAHSVHRLLWRAHHLPLLKRLLLYRFAYWPAGIYWKHAAALLLLDALALGLAGALVAWALR